MSRTLWNSSKTFFGTSLLAAAFFLAPGGVSVVRAEPGDSHKMVIQGKVEAATDAQSCEADPNPAATALRQQRATQETLRAAMEKAKDEGRIKPLNGRGYNYAVNNEQKAQLLQLQREVHEARVKAAAVKH